jgi:hypothetical protein
MFSEPAFGFLSFFWFLRTVCPILYLGVLLYLAELVSCQANLNNLAWVTWVLVCMYARACVT